MPPPVGSAGGSVCTLSVMFPWYLWYAVGDLSPTKLLSVSSAAWDWGGQIRYWGQKVIWRLDMLKCIKFCFVLAALFKFSTELNWSYLFTHYWVLLIDHTHYWCCLSVFMHVHVTRKWKAYIGANVPPGRSNQCANFHLKGTEVRE